MTEVLSPCFSECDSVSGLLDKDNNIKNTNKTSKLDILNQVVQSFRFSKSRNYSTLGSCPNLARLSSKTLLLKENSLSCHNNNDKMLNINTPYGTVRIYKTGNPQGPYLVTLHDIGLNGFSNFNSFWSHGASSGVVSKFCVLNLTLPGQETGATSLPHHYSYPGMEDMVTMVEVVLDQLRVTHCVLMGVGMGGYIALNIAVKTPKLVDGLITINTTCSSAGWMEWASHKVNISALRRANSVPESVVDFLIWHHLGNSAKDRESKNFGVISLYRSYFSTETNPSNLSLLLHSYANRKELSLSRASIKMPVLNIVGESSPHVDATINMNMKVDPAKSTWMKINNAGMVLEEQPEKVAEAMILFLQGLGYTLKIMRSKSATVRPTKLELKGYETPLVKLKVVKPPEGELLRL